MLLAAAAGYRTVVLDGEIVAVSGRLSPSALRGVRPSSALTARQPASKSSVTCGARAGGNEQQPGPGLHYSALRTGLAFLPLTVAVFALSRTMPRVLARTGPRLPLLCGAALIAISLAWLSQTSVSQGYLGGLFGPLLLFGIGIGLSYVPMGATILKGVDRDDSGSASGMYQAMQQIGGSVGLAILVSIAVGHGQSAALEGAAGFGVLAFVVTALALSGRAAHR